MPTETRVTEMRHHEFAVFQAPITPESKLLYKLIVTEGQSGETLEKAHASESQVSVVLYDGAGEVVANIGFGALDVLRSVLDEAIEKSGLDFVGLKTFVVEGQKGPLYALA